MAFGGSDHVRDQPNELDEEWNFVSGYYLCEFGFMVCFGLWKSRGGFSVPPKIVQLVANCRQSRRVARSENQGTRQEVVNLLEM